MARTPDGPPPPPDRPAAAVRYAKRGRLRFSSHRDFQRAFERALRRAAVPMAYSAGFSPHPKISYAGAAPTGTASEAEYLEIARRRSAATPSGCARRSTTSLPPGLDVLEVVEAAPRAPSLADRLEASVWEIRLPGVAYDDAAQGRRRPSWRPTRSRSTRMTKNGLRTFDARAAGRWPADAPRCGTATPTARCGPAVCDTATGRTARHTGRPTRRRPRRAPPRGRPRAAGPTAVTRLAQGPLDEAAGTVSDPLAPDRHDRRRLTRRSAPSRLRRCDGAPQTSQTVRPRCGRHRRQLPCGARRSPDRSRRPARPAPGSVTGAHPDARQRAHRRRPVTTDRRRTQSTLRRTQAAAAPRRRRRGRQPARPGRPARPPSSTRRPMPATGRAAARPTKATREARPPRSATVAAEPAKQADRGGQPTGVAEAAPGDRGRQSAEPPPAKKATRKRHPQEGGRRRSSPPRPRPTAAADAAVGCRPPTATAGAALPAARAGSRTRRAAVAASKAAATADAGGAEPPRPTSRSSRRTAAEDGGRRRAARTTEGGGPRRRRRGGRGRRGRGRGARGRGTAEPATTPRPRTPRPTTPPRAPTRPRTPRAPTATTTSGATGTRRRRRRRRRGGGRRRRRRADTGRPAEHRRPGPRAAQAPGAAAERRHEDDDGVRSIKGSTRLEAKKQRRREGREAGRRRPPILSEAEFLARRESVDRVMVVRQTRRAHPDRRPRGRRARRALRRPRVADLAGRQRLPRQGAERAALAWRRRSSTSASGRNAVLYAGEVNWDAAGLDGQPRRIEPALKSGDSVLVQVTKDPIGHKGARLTSQISPARPLPGLRARRLDDRHQPQAARHRAHPAQGDPQGDRPRRRRRHRAHRGRGRQRGGADPRRRRGSAAQWEDIEKKAEDGHARPRCSTASPTSPSGSSATSSTRTSASSSSRGDDAWDMVEDYVGHVAPDLADRLDAGGPTSRTSSPRTGSTSRSPRRSTARSGCPRGGSLVIDRTEAMTVVDVNTGKFTGSGRQPRGDRHQEQPRGGRGDRPPAPAARHRRHHRRRLHRHGARDQPRPRAAPAASSAWAATAPSTRSPRSPRSAWCR